MKKQLFKNYSFSFDKNERKVLLNFSKQVAKQAAGDEKLFNEEKIFNSIIVKLSGNDDPVKFTKDEKTRLVMQLKENIKFIQQSIKKSWFLKRWLLKSLLSQYTIILETHFED